jgi:NAD(P)H dehydrogenase (quinone)
MPAKPKILVTSAAGQTGSAAALQLLEKGIPVRAFVRRRDARAVALKQAGAEIFVGDLFDYRDLRRSMTGVQRAYHCPPFDLNLLNNAAQFAVAAEEAKLEVVALLSQWTPHALHPSIVTREHWLANQIYRWMPSVDVVHINPGLFGFTYLLGLPAIAHFGQFMAPFGDGLNAPPSNEDIGRVVAAVLTSPAAHIGKTYRPTGPALISPADVAGTLGHILGRQVSYNDVPFKMFAKAGLAQGFRLFELAHLRYNAEDLKSGAFAAGGPTDHVLQVTGHAQEDFETMARRYIDNPTLIHPAMRIGTKAQAIGFLLRMLARRAPDLDAWERERGYPLLNEPVLAMDSAEWLASAECQQLNLLPGTALGPALTVIA